MMLVINAVYECLLSSFGVKFWYDEHSKNKTNISDQCFLDIRLSKCFGIKFWYDKHSKNYIFSESMLF